MRAANARRRPADPRRSIVPAITVITVKSRASVGIQEAEKIANAPLTSPTTDVGPIVSRPTTGRWAMNPSIVPASRERDRS